MREEEVVWLETPLHKNKFPKIDIPSVAGVKLSFDGSIMAVEKSRVESHYHSNEVELVRSGYKKMPKDISLETEDDLYSFLSYFIIL